jgi:acyl-CoA thioesterase
MFEPTKEDARVPVHRFDLDTAVRNLGDGRFEAEMSEHWWVERGPNGGYVAAVVLRAIQAAAAIKRPPRSLTVQFPRAPVAGSVEITVKTEREGGTVTFLSARMEQQGKLQATALAVLADDLDASGFAELQMPAVDPPTELYSPDPAQVSGMPTMFQNYDVRPALGDEAFSGGAPYSGLWIRAREPRLLDAPLAAAMLDAWFPAPFIRLERPVPAPTIDYTVHFRSPLPPPDATADDPYLAVFKTGLARHGFFEEDGELWSADGVLLAHSRQLALLLERPTA